MFVSHAARAYAIAQAYAEERVQGRKPDGSPAVLTDHADVRRMLAEQRDLAIGARTMAHIALVEMEKGTRPELAEFLTPLCKFFCTEAGIRAADLGIQVLGGYGYLTEYRVAQTWRDARITSIYEGANGIHYLTLATRGVRAKGGAAADAFEALIPELSSSPKVKEKLSVWRDMRASVKRAADPSEHAYAFAQASGDLMFCAVLERHGNPA